MTPSSPTPVHLDTLAVIEAARAAHAYGLLTAQAPDADQRGCLYNYHGRVCAIGAALPDTFRHEGAVLGFIEVGDFIGNAIALPEIQDAHDRWVNALEKHRPEAEAAFLRTLSEVGGRHG